VEERMMEIIKQRKAGQQSGSRPINAEGEVQPEGQGKAGAHQNMAGSLKTDRQNLRAAELELLFKVHVTIVAQLELPN